jgi:hypothetical protein
LSTLNNGGQATTEEGQPACGKRLLGRWGETFDRISAELALVGKRQQAEGKMTKAEFTDL